MPQLDGYNHPKPCIKFCTRALKKKKSFSFCCFCDIVENDWQKLVNMEEQTLLLCNLWEDLGSVCIICLALLRWLQRHRGVSTVGSPCSLIFCSSTNKVLIQRHISSWKMQRNIPNPSWDENKSLLSCYIIPAMFIVCLRRIISPICSYCTALLSCFPRTALLRFSA